MIDIQGKKALLTVFTVVLLITIMCMIVGCQKVSEDNIPALIEEAAIDAVEAVADDVVKDVSGVNPKLDFNGNNKD